MIRVANAPVSYGVFELTVGRAPTAPPDELLAAIASAGYEGSELGPPGYLGDREALRARLDRFGLALAGGYIPVPFGEPERWEEGVAETLDLLEPDARPVFADAGPWERLDAAGWRRLAEGVRRVAGLARDRGLEPVFHHHLGTHVQGPSEIERLLELTDVALLLDTGHLALGGGDPCARSATGASGSSTCT